MCVGNRGPPGTAQVKVGRDLCGVRHSRFAYGVPISRWTAGVPWTPADDTAGQINGHHKLGFIGDWHLVARASMGRRVPDRALDRRRLADRVHIPTNPAGKA